MSGSAWPGTGCAGGFEIPPIERTNALDLKQAKVVDQFAVTQAVQLTSGIIPVCQRDDFK